MYTLINEFNTLQRQGSVSCMFIVVKWEKNKQRDQMLITFLIEQLLIIHWSEHLKPVSVSEAFLASHGNTQSLTFHWRTTQWMSKTNIKKYKAVFTSSPLTSPTAVFFFSFSHYGTFFCVIMLYFVTATFACYSSVTAFCVMRKVYFNKMRPSLWNNLESFLL